MKRPPRNGRLFSFQPRDQTVEFAARAHAFYAFAQIDVALHHRRAIKKTYREDPRKAEPILKRNPPMRKLLIPALAAAALAGAAAPAFADAVTIRVSAEGLDFAHASDIAAMKGRIDTAVRKACNSSSLAARYSNEAVDACVADGTAKALAELDARLAGQS
jgi:UrcA family protein